MPRGGPLIAEDFILPALNNETYGDTLMWINQSVGLFQLKLMHKNNANWKEDYTRVFQDWDSLKGREKASYTNNGYLTDAKQRFKNALRKCRFLIEADRETLLKLGLDKQKQTLFFIYNKSYRSVKSVKRNQDDIRIQSVVSALRASRDGNQFNSNYTSIDLMSSNPQSNQSGAVVQFPTKFTEINDFEKKEKYICFKLPTGLSGIEPSNGFCIRLQSNNILQQNSVTLIEDQTLQTETVKPTSTTALNDNAYPHSLQRVKDFDDVEDSSKPNKKKSILPCDDSDSSTGSDDENRLVVCDSPFQNERINIASGILLLANECLKDHAKRSKLNTSPITIKQESCVN